MNITLELRRIRPAISCENVEYWFKITSFAKLQTSRSTVPNSGRLSIIISSGEKAEMLGFTFLIARSTIDLAVVISFETKTIDLVPLEKLETHFSTVASETKQSS
jgi:hypothetical protein